MDDDTLTLRTSPQVVTTAPRVHIVPPRRLRHDSVAAAFLIVASIGLVCTGAEPPRLHPPADQVRLWERFEGVIRNDRPYGDPVRDVILDVVYTAPSGAQIKFWGFYDRGDMWKFRFMPHQPGTWRYEARFSDGTRGTNGSFQVEGVGGLPGMLQVYPRNPIWFSAAGKPVLIRGLHIGDRFFAANWPEHKRAAFLDWIQKQDYNLLSIASHYLNRDIPGRGRGWDTPKLWPLDPAEYRKMERILDDLADRQIIVYPFAGFFGKNSNYPHDPQDQELYVRYTVARLGPYWNILLNVAGPEPNLGSAWMPSEEVVRLGRLIRRLDVFSHPLSVHNRTGDDPYRDSDWTSFITLQGPKTRDRQALSRGLLRNHNPNKPLLAQETLWSRNENHPDYSDDDLRRNAYVIGLSGASLVFGDMNGDSSSGFSGSMEVSERNQKRHDIIKVVWDFFESIPFSEMTPRQDLVTNGYCLAQPGSAYLVYLETGGQVDVMVEEGSYSVTWINARDTLERRSSGTTRDGKHLRAPDDRNDWLLHLKRTAGTPTD